jgi:hypothetical protein
MRGDMCMGDLICRYGDNACACLQAGGNRREWDCARVGDAGGNADCPPAPPATGGDCSGPGAGTICAYPQIVCACDQQEQWLCRP